MLDIKRFFIKTTALKPWVKFIWHLETESIVTVNNKLLPTDSIDIILNLSDPIEYQFRDQKIIASDFHFNGMRNKYGFISQEGKLNVFGISFYPFGLYPFIQTPMSQFKNQIVDLQSVSELLYKGFCSILMTDRRIDKITASIEAALLSSLNLKESDAETLLFLQTFYCSGQLISIKDFCLENHIGQKTFERACLKYTGFGPKTLQRLSRFQMTSNQLIYSRQEDNFTDLSYNNDYYDQAHFIREFKEFSGASPSRFMNERCTVKENTKYTFE